MESSIRVKCSLNHVDNTLSLVLKRKNLSLHYSSRIGCRNCLCVFSLVSWMIMESSIEPTTSLNHEKNPFLIWIHKRGNWYVYGIMEHVVEGDMD